MAYRRDDDRFRGRGRGGDEREREDMREAGPHDRDDRYFDRSRYYDPERIAGEGRPWGRDRDRYDRDFGGRDVGEYGGGGRGGSTSYAAYEGSYGYGGYGGHRGYGMGGPRGMGEMGERERWGFGGRGTDLGFGSPDHEQAERGPHRGKGPKGWKRSDERLREDVCEAIASQGYVDASDVEVRAENGTIILSGTVQQRGDKKMLERFVERVSGVDDVRNELRIRREARGEAQAQASTERPRAEKPQQQNGNARS